MLACACYLVCVFSANGHHTFFQQTATSNLEDDRVSAGGGCETAVTVRTRCGWVKFRQYDELPYGNVSYNAERGCL